MFPDHDANKFPWNLNFIDMHCFFCFPQNHNYQNHNETSSDSPFCEYFRFFRTVLIVEKAPAVLINSSSFDDVCFSDSFLSSTVAIRSLWSKNFLRRQTEPTIASRFVRLLALKLNFYIFSAVYVCTYQLGGSPMLVYQIVHVFPDPPFLL